MNLLKFRLLEILNIPKEQNGFTNMEIDVPTYLIYKSP